MKAKSARHLSLSIFLALLLVLIAVVGVSALSYTPPGSVQEFSWLAADQASGPRWTTGNDPGYWEGETAVLSAGIVGEKGKTYALPICLQGWELPLPTKAYAFTGFAPFNTTKRAPYLPPVTLPGNENITYAAGMPSGPEWDVSHPPVYGYNITIESVTAQAIGAVNGCSDNEVGLIVTYTPKANNHAYLIWGGHIAKSGDALLPGCPDTIVPVGKSAGYATGNFQARLKTEQADKTLPFKVHYGPNALALNSLSATPQTIPLAAGLALGLLVLAGTAGMVKAWRRA